VPPHWFVPVGRSDPDKRKDEVKSELGQKGKLHSFWEGNDGNLYALVKDCPGLDDDHDLKQRLKVTGPLLGLDREVKL
jgi:hypothetical protein